MEKNLEHKIAEAYQRKDASTKYRSKDELWNRLQIAQKSNKSVNRFWRIAAIFIAAFFVTGAFAGFHFLKKSNSELTQLQKEKSQLSASLDSLQNIPIEVLTEIKTIEKEVKIFMPIRDVEKKEAATNEHLEALSAKNIELKLQLEKDKRHWENKLDSMENELIALRKIAEKNTNINKEIADKARIDVVVLKPEMPKDVLQQPVQNANLKFKIQFFNNSSETVKYDMNSSILKK